MIPRGKTWLIDVLDLQIEAWIPEPGEFPTEEEREENRGLWFDLTCFTRYPEPYYADELIEAVLDIHEAVTGHRMTLHGDTHDDYVWDRIYSDMEFAAVSCAFRLKKHEWAPLPVLDEIPEINYKPQPIVPERLTYIGVKLVDQDGEPVERSRVRVKLPDGDIREGRTDRDGELMIKGFGLDGIAEIELLDFLEALPEAATAEEEEEVAAEEVAAAEDAIVGQKEFVVKVVDETGKGVSGVSLVFIGAGTSKSVPTDGGGVAKWKAAAESVEVTFESAEALAKLMKPIWTSSRGIDRNDWVEADDTTTAVTLYGGNVVKVTPDGGSSKQALEGFFGISVSGGNPGEASEPMMTFPVQPLVIVVEMLGERFDTDKCFLLPSALESVRELVKLHKEYEQTDLLIVGHTDTSASDDHNLALSLERTAAMRAYLTDDAAAWLPWYDDDKPAKKRWGETEDTYMIEALLEGTEYPTTVLGYQQWHNELAPQKSGYATLKEDGKIGPETRKQLVTDYMRREDTTVPAGTKIVVHGCGEYFPLDSSGEALDTNAANGRHEQEDRRVEVFLFPKEIGILPPVPGEKAKKGEKEYPEWRQRAIKFSLLALNVPDYITLQLYLQDENRKLMKDTSCELTIGGEVRNLKSNAEGFVRTPRVPVPSKCVVKWAPDPEYLYETELELTFSDDANSDLQRDAQIRLNNLGYGALTFNQAWAAFQIDYGNGPPKPWFDQAAHDLLVDVHSKGIEASSSGGDATTA